MTGFLLVALPLAGALLWSAWNTERLAERGTRAVVNASQVARASRSLVNHAGSLERLARQIAVQPESELVADFERAHTNFTTVSGELARLPLDSERLSALNGTIERERALHQIISNAGRDPVDLREVVARAADVVEGAYEVLSISHIIADREVERLRESAEDSRRFLVFLVMVAGAAALAVTIVLARVIAQPIAQLDDAIRRLGRADFERPIRVSGPKDLEYLGERLDWLRRRLTELESEKSRFLRHLSHDLKTPLTALREGAELLGDQVAGPLVPSQRQVVEILRENSIKLQKMIEDLLDYQRALHSAATLDAEPVALEPLLRSSVQAQRLAAAAKGQRVVIEASPSMVWADATKLRSIVDNLLGNAVKFTPSGGTITVRVHERGSGVEIDVIDTGPGVPVEEKEVIFDAFFRGRAGASGRAEGTGLGLAIARDFVQAHGGKIEVVQDSPGGHFRVMLPKYPAPAIVEVA